MTQRNLIDHLVARGVLKNAAVRAAFVAVDRADFVPPRLREYAYDDGPLPIGEGQTISQPYTVALMLDWLAPAYGMRVLDIGSGSGWQTALLASIVSTPLGGEAGNRGHVTALERIPDVCELGRANLAHYDFIERGIVEIHCMSGEEGFPSMAPYDRIIAAAMLDDVPPAWPEQLADDGVIVAPVAGSVVRWQKQLDGTFARDEYPGFAFVPFVKD